MKISIIGTGYVGLCTAAGFALKGHDVVCTDIDSKKIEMINLGEPPITEDGLAEAMKKTKNRLKATTDIKEAVAGSAMIFLCVGTPSMKDGSIDITYVKKASEDIGANMAITKDYSVVVVKSTVIPGSTEDVIIPIIEKKSGKKCGKDFGVCMNPEFLREGTAIGDFLKPDRVVIGEYDKKSGDALEKLYKNFGAPVMRTKIKTAEMIKYASNSFLATKISTMNEIGNICKRLGIDAYEVAKGIGYDKRIGNNFLDAGIGFGGSCFSKDLHALRNKANEVGYTAGILDSVIKLNDNQRMEILKILKNRITPLKGKKIAVLGLAFKPGTDDIRDSPAIDIVSALKKEGCTISAYDPKAAKNFKMVHPDIAYTNNSADAIKNADACLILTEWDEFRKLSDKEFSSMKGKVIIEGRRTLESGRVKNFEGVCW